MTPINPGPVNHIKRPTLSRSILNPEATALPTILDDNGEDICGRREKT